MKERVWMSLNGEFLKEMEEKARKKAEEEAAKPPKVRKKRRKAPINAASAGLEYKVNYQSCLPFKTLIHTSHRSET